MEETITCRAVAERDIAGRYVAKRLTPTEEAAFESHFLTCDRCQREVRLAAGIAGAAKELPPVAATAARRPTRVRLGVIIGAALAAGIAGVITVANVARRPSVEDLGVVREPPAFVGVPVRASESASDSLFAAGMRAYTERRFAEAEPLLGKALSAGVDSTSAEFFRAASQLMLARAREAADGFARVVALGPSPYADEAKYYRAKALLQLGNAEDALAALRSMSPGPSAITSAARAFRDSVEARLDRVTRRP